MHAQASSQALHVASVLPTRHAIRFGIACVLSSILVLVAGIRAFAYFQPSKKRSLSQLAISVIFGASCVSLLGVISSKVYSSLFELAQVVKDGEFAYHEGVALGLLIWISSISGIYEVGLANGRDNFICLLVVG
jgi:hypothetical protein